MKNTEIPSLISIIIPAYNAEKTIALTIQALHNQTYNGAKEIIVVDDGSTDKTGATVQQFADVKYIYQKNAGPASARNRGAKKAHGDVLCFTDSDCIPNPDWLERIINCLTETKAPVIAGSYDIFNSNVFLAQCIYAEIRFRHDKLMPKFPNSFGSYNFCIKRNLFETISGFDETYKFASGEDNDLAYRILKNDNRIYFCPSARVKHIFPERLSQYLKEQYRHGFWRAKMYRDHPKMVKGDDYTFWKDISEPFFVMAICFFFFLWIFSFVPLGAWAFLILLLILIEGYFGWQSVSSFSLAAGLTFVMFLRAFFRTIGFLQGIFVFYFLRRGVKKIK